MQRTCCVTLFQKTVLFFLEQFIHFQGIRRTVCLKHDLHCVNKDFLNWITLCFFWEGQKLCKVSNRNILFRLLVTPKLGMVEKKRDFWAISRYFKSFVFFLFIYFVCDHAELTLVGWTLINNKFWRKNGTRGEREGRLSRKSRQTVVFKPSRVTRNSRSPCVFFNVGLKWKRLEQIANDEHSLLKTSP